MLLRDLPIGSLVKDSNSLFLGEPVIWRIADKNHEGYPDNSVTLITDKIVAIRAFDAREPNNSNTDRQSYGNNRYSVSNIRQWINSDAEAGEWYSAQHDADQAPTAGNVYSDYNIYADDAGFLNGFSQNFKNALLDTTLTVGLNTVTDGGGSETVTDKIFLASKTEVGLTNENNIAEGTLLSIFTDAVSRCTTVTQECLEDTNSTNGPHNTTDPYDWWLRTPYATKSGYSRYVNESGSIGGHHTYRGHYGVRPLCNVSSSVSVSSTTDEDGCYILFDIPSIEGYLDSKGLAQVVQKIKEHIANTATTEKETLVYRGDYDNTIAYNTGDVVRYVNDSHFSYYFISLIDNNNNEITGPTVSSEYWANINYHTNFAEMVKLSDVDFNVDFPIPIMNGNYVYKPFRGVQATINANTGLLKVMGLEINGSPAATEEYVDDRGIKILEASTVNVIDFNTLTETGLYLIKNVTSTTATNVFFSTGSTSPLDIFLEVVEHRYSNGTAIYQRLNVQSTVPTYTRTCNTSGTWSDWSAKISAGFISAGKLGGKVSANETAVAALTDSQVRNIKVQTTDLTAGTSTLATGDIVFIYE